MPFDLGDSSSSLSSDKELQQFLLIQQQKAQFHAQVHRLNEICWEKCVDKPGSKLDNRTQTCITNCVERFIDSSIAITSRFAQLLQHSASRM